MGLPLAHWMPVVTDLLQAATNGLPRLLRIMNTEMGNFLFDGVMSVPRLSAFVFFSLLSLSAFYVRENHKPFCKNLVGIHE